jgi:hypothetical protein
MDDKRQELHKLVDALPDETLQGAERALKYGANPGATRVAMARVQGRAKEARKRLEEHAKRMGHGLIGMRSGVGSSAVNGDFHHSVHDGPVTYHLRCFSGCMFEVYETLELAKDGGRLMLTYRIIGPDAVEQVLTANIPAADSAAEQQRA